MEPPFTLGSSVELTIDDLSYGGDGVGHPEGIAVFVPRTGPGDRVRVKITDVRRRFARSIAEEILTPSSHRATPPCPLFSECGGCHYQHLDPTFVLEQKKKQLHETFKRLGPGEIPIRDFVTSGRSLNYRNRLTYHRVSNGNQGYVAWTDHRILDVDDCPIADRDLNDLWREIRPQIQKISSDLLPYVVLRKTGTGQLAVLLSVTAEVPPELRKLSFKREVFVYSTWVKPWSRTPFGKEITAISGPNSVTEEVLGIRYTVRPDLFFQIHPDVAASVVERVVGEAKGVNPTRALDLYCGAGLLTLALAKNGIQTLGVEVQYASIQSAQVSAEANGLSALATFRAGKADRILERLSRAGEKFDLVVADPPRGGLDGAVIQFLDKIGARTLIYVSCSPATLARDLKSLLPLGFRAEWAEPFDMFPQTYHFEVVTLLRKQPA